MDRRIVLLLALFIPPPAAFAIGATFELWERTADGLAPDHDGRYDRYFDYSFGAKVIFSDPLYDEDGNYLVTPGESWTWRWDRIDLPQKVYEGSVTYLGGDGMCWSNGTCGPSRDWYYGINWPCMPEGRYRVSVTHNGSPMGSGDYRPTRFGPAFLEIMHPAALRPALSAEGQGAWGFYTVTATDDFGCGQPIEGTEAAINSFVADGDTNHAHMRQEVGTGKFLAAPGFEATIVGAPPTTIVGTTDANGRFLARYQAGQHGVKEKFVTKLSRPADGDDPQLDGPTLESSIDLKVAGLGEITSANAQVVFADGGKCPHEPYPHWLTPGAMLRMRSMAYVYNYFSGRMLSLNDASVAYGGVIDNNRDKGYGRDATCHDSHRRGVDTDVNKKDSAGQNIRVTTVNVAGKDWIAIDLLDNLADAYGGSRVAEEGSIHYRFDY